MSIIIKKINKNPEVKTTLLKGSLANGTVVYMTLCGNFFTPENTVIHDFALAELYANAKVTTLFDASFPQNLIDFGLVKFQAIRISWGLLDRIESSLVIASKKLA